MPIPESKWIGRQLKARILLDKHELTLLVKQMRLGALCSGAAAPIWDIIIAYTCEDPKIIDVILSRDWCIPSKTDPSLMTVDHAYHYDGIPYLKIIRWRDANSWLDTIDDDPSQIDWRFDDSKAWNVLLMLPSTVDDGDIETECTDVQGLMKLRKFLYAQISSS